MREEHGLISGSGAHLEHALFAVEMQELEILGVDRWLGDRLAAADGKRRVLVRLVPQSGRNEKVTRCHLERAENREIIDASRANRLDEAMPGAAKLRVYGSRHHLSAVFNSS